MDFKRDERLDRAADIIAARYKYGDLIPHSDIIAISREVGKHTNTAHEFLYRLDARLRARGFVVHNHRSEGWRLLPPEDVLIERSRVRRKRAIGQINALGRELAAVPPHAVSAETNMAIADAQGRNAAVKSMLRRHKWRPE